MRKKFRKQQDRVKRKKMFYSFMRVVKPYLLILFTHVLNKLL